ncbi:hypothetical protein K402DRAFT_362573 [Aulographum hederae CBS 113979]|uniref:Efficient mitochondria targeting-associated protein 19 n=1 Tax=Aulographum hederae CBS 113979 TaxID=1176131 RepID=A0A6G1GPK6_9PEZI|nr:hypothetical protein K402DRAFT_362573 [Aulographum hederae CBS 113979]
MARPLLSRKLDIIYLVFFCVHIPIMLVVDLTPLYPAAVKPGWLYDLRAYHVATYKDRFFVEPPAWFNTYIWMEALYHIPLSLWAIPAILRDDTKLPLHLLVFACQTALTTLTCIAEAMSWEGFTSEDKLNLASLYVPYFALAVFMGVDMFGRLSGKLDGVGEEGKGKKRQ